MKKYNYLISLSIIIYMILAFLSGNAIFGLQEQHNRAYRVEINRAIEHIKTKEDVQTIQINDYTYLKKIEFLDITSQNKQTSELFFKANNEDNIHISPLYQADQLLGYLRFTYQTPKYNMSQIMIILEVSLFVLEGLLLMYLFYIKKHLIKPFQRLNSLPEEIAKGHLKGEVKEEKSKYFGQFMWGMSQLKDTLETSNKRQLDLLSEKKKLLLSLSHDIKTPLNLIKLYSKALDEDIYPDLAAKENAVKQISVKALEIEEYINQIMESTREDLFDLPVNNSDFYLKDLINKVLSVYQEQCQLRQIEFKVEPFVNRLIRGDIERSQEVLENLFENAFKYGDGRKIEISFYEEDYCQLVRFYNSGEGVNDHELNHLFDSFFRASNSDGKSGNGLGLYICRELMRKMDGDIFVEKVEDGIAFVLVFR